MRILDLFSGTGSSTQAFKDSGHNVYTVELDTQFDADFHVDIMHVTPDFFPGRWDLVWASPPCTTFSVASIGTHWTGGKEAYIPKTQAAKDGIELMYHTRDLIAGIDTRYWVVENPRGVLRKLGIFGEPQTVWYCQYGDERAKPTDLFGNLPPDFPILTCKNNNPACDHVRARRGAKTGTQGRKGAKERSMIPYALSLQMMNSILEEDAR